MQRRDWIKKTGAGGIAAIAPSALLGDVVLGFDQTLAQIVGHATVQSDKRVELFVPEDAANGAVVPVGIVSSIPDTLKIVLLVSDHVRSKVAALDTSNSMLAPRLSTHVQLSEASTLTALVQNESGWFSSTANVKTLGESCEK